MLIKVRAELAGLMKLRAELAGLMKQKLEFYIFLFIYMLVYYHIKKLKTE